MNPRNSRRFISGILQVSGLLQGFLDVESVLIGVVDLRLSSPHVPLLRADPIGLLQDALYGNSKAGHLGGQESETGHNALVFRDVELQEGALCAGLGYLSQELLFDQLSGCTLTSMLFPRLPELRVLLN
jgi:hypothetical protein